MTATVFPMFAKEHSVVLANADTSEYNYYQAVQIAKLAAANTVSALFKEVLNRTANLDNCTEAQNAPSGGAEMKSQRIDRYITINGQNTRIRANSEEEYVLKAYNLLYGKPVSTSDKGKHAFTAYADNWFNVFAKPNIEPATAISYMQQLRAHILPAFSGKTVEDISTADVQNVFNSMDGCKSTQQKVKNIMSMIFDQAIEDGIIQKNPVKARCIRLHGKSSKTTEPYSVDEMKYIISHIGNVKNPVDRNYIALQALHALRLEEVLGLKWEDIDLAANLIHVERAVTHPNRNQPIVTNTKTEASRRTLDLVPQIIPYLTIGSPDEFVVGCQPISYQQLKRICKRIQKDMGLDFTITPRRFRTTVLTDLYDSTKDIKLAQAAAGHTTAAMTLKHYVKGRNSTASTAAPVANLYGLT